MPVLQVSCTMNLVAAKQLALFFRCVEKNGLILGIIEFCLARCEHLYELLSRVKFILHRFGVAVPPSLKLTCLT